MQAMAKMDVMANMDVEKILIMERNRATSRRTTPQNELMPSPVVSKSYRAKNRRRPG